MERVLASKSTLISEISQEQYRVFAKRATLGMDKSRRRLVKEMVWRNPDEPVGDVEQDCGDGDAIIESGVSVPDAGVVFNAIRVRSRCCVRLLPGPVGDAACVRLCLCPGTMANDR